MKTLKVTSQFKKDLKKYKFKPEVISKLKLFLIFYGRINPYLMKIGLTS